MPSEKGLRNKMSYLFGTDRTAFLFSWFSLLAPLIIVHDALWQLAERYLIRTENIIAYISDYSFPFFLPMGVFIAFLINFTHRLRKLKKRENQVWNPIEKEDKKQLTKWKIKFSLICVCVFIACSAVMCAGTLQRTVITSDYTVKNYNFTGQISAEYEPEDIRFVKIYPEAVYDRYSGFEYYDIIIKIFINENDCFAFWNQDFDSFEQLVEYKNVLTENGVPVYVKDCAENEPDPETENLTDDELTYIENFYSEYEKLK